MTDDQIRETINVIGQFAQTMLHAEELIVKLTSLGCARSELASSLGSLRCAMMALSFAAPPGIALWPMGNDIYRASFDVVAEQINPEAAVSVKKGGSN